MGKNRMIVVDGANIAYELKTKKGNARVSNITAVKQALEEKGYQTLIIVDASLRHEIDDPDQLESLIDSQLIMQAPAGADADFFILETADREEAYVVSNDLFEPYQERYTWINERRIPFMIINGDVQLYLPKLEKDDSEG
jgi:hypothetical protein